jgi:hypothetical protein
VSRYNTWKKIGLGAAFLAVIASPEALHALSAAPQRRPVANASPAQVAGDKSFVPTCKANEVVDTRPDPAWVGQSFAHDNCWAPQLPARIDGYSATRQQIVAGMTAEKVYIAAADVYQKCISDFVTDRQRQAGKSKKPVDMALIMIENHRVTASQENKKKAAALIDGAIEAFNEYGSECL